MKWSFIFKGKFSMLTVLEKDQYTIEDSNICFLNGEINSQATEYIFRFIIEKNNPEKEKELPDHLKMIINSPGGYAPECFAIIDMMKAYSIPVWTYGIGQICSCGLLIFMSGDKGHRFIFKNCSILSHQWSGIAEGKQHELKAVQKEDKLTNKRIYNLYESATGLPKEEIDKILLGASDTWLSPSEAVKYKIADKIVTKI
jgi:ATP-dependent Clp protease, protease subunit